MDARFIRTQVMGPLTVEEAIARASGGCGATCPAKGRIALMAGGILRLLHENLAGELSDAATSARSTTSRPCRTPWSPTARW